MDKLNVWQWCGCSKNGLIRYSVEDMNKVNGTLELMQIISSISPTDEYVVEGNYETRENIIYNLTMNKDWELDAEISSSNNIWYLFVNDKMKARVSINCGIDSIFDDIVITKFN